MKRDKENTREILDRGLKHHGNLSQHDVNGAIERAWDAIGPEAAGTDWNPAPAPFSRKRGFPFRLALAAATLLVAVVPFVVLRYGPTGGYAVVESLDKGIYRVTNDDNESLSHGASIDIGDTVSSNEKVGTVVLLRDGSTVEMRSDTEFSVERARDGVRLNLRKGSIIVNASKQPAGHLYVQTKELIVSVVGTVFMVNAETEGSHVAVIEGEVLVKQGETTKNLLPGEQLLTGLQPESRPVAEEIAWSRTAAAHVALLQQTAAPSATPPRKQLEFDVVSMRPVSGEKNVREAGGALRTMAAPGHIFGDEPEIRCKGIDGAWSSQYRNVMANASSIPLGRCMGMAGASYFVRIIREIDHPGVTSSDYSKLSKGLDNTPGGDSILYVMNAKAEYPEKTTKADLLEMLRNYALNQLKLKYHLETRIVDGWAVRVAPGGLKMKETSLDAEDRLSDVGQGSGYRKRIQQFLSGMAPRSGLTLYGPVIDMTGLTGKVFEFTWTPKINPSLPGATGPRGAPGEASVPVPDYDPPLEKQFEEQLGLTIKKEKVPVQYLVVDHIERPPEN